MDWKDKVGRAKNIFGALKMAVSRVVKGKCMVCGECKEQWKDAEVCANRECEKCPIN